jgi:hypothetical protein
MLNRIVLPFTETAFIASLSVHPPDGPVVQVPSPGSEVLTTTYNSPASEAPGARSVSAATASTTSERSITGAAIAVVNRLMSVLH